MITASMALVGVLASVAVLGCAVFVAGAVWNAFDASRTEWRWPNEREAATMHVCFRCGKTILTQIEVTRAGGRNVAVHADRFECPGMSDLEHRAAGQAPPA